MRWSEGGASQDHFQPYHSGGGPEMAQHWYGSCDTWTSLYCADRISCHTSIMWYRKFLIQQSSYQVLFFSCSAFLEIGCFEKKFLLCPQVAYNEADLGVTNFVCSYVRSTVVDCSHPTQHASMHWVSRYPRPLPPTITLTSLLSIYNGDCWILIFICIFSVSVFLVLASKVGASYGVTVSYEELVLIPFRLVIKYQPCTKDLCQIKFTILQSSVTV